MTPDNINDYLSGKMGSLSNKKLVLTPGNYGQLVIGLPEEFEGSDTVYTCQNGSTHSGEVLSFTSAEEFLAHYGTGEWHGTPYYTRTIDNLKLVGQDGAKVAGITIASGHAYGTGVLDPVKNEIGDNSRYFLTHKISNLSFENITFTSRVNIETSMPDTVIDHVTFDGCTFDINNIASGNQALRYYNELNNGNVRN